MQLSRLIEKGDCDRRGDRWLSFYEDFLSVYDPDERRQAGVYHTPVPVVEAMTAITGKLLIDRLGKRLGFADPNVVTLDPATGTGTFPLAVIDHAAKRNAVRVLDHQPPMQVPQRRTVLTVVKMSQRIEVEFELAIDGLAAALRTEHLHRLGVRHLA